MSSDGMKRLIIQNAFKRGAEKRKREQELELLGNRAAQAESWIGTEGQAAVAENPYTQQDQMLNEQNQWGDEELQDLQGQGLLSGTGAEAQPAVEATGLFQGLKESDRDQKNILNTYRGMLGQEGDKFSQETALEGLNAVMKSRGGAKGAGYSNIKMIGAPEKWVTKKDSNGNEIRVNVNENKKQGAVFDPTQPDGVKWLGDPLDPRNMYTDAGLHMQKTNDPTARIGKNVKATAAAKQEGTSGVKARYATLKTIEEGMALGQKTLQNYSNMRTEIANGGASPNSLISKWTPDIKASTMALRQQALQAGLDIVSGTTFGSLSEKELAVAMEAAIPAFKTSKELDDWLVARTSAQQKLMNEMLDVGRFIASGGTQIEWQEIKRKEERDRAKAQKKEEAAVRRVKKQGLSDEALKAKHGY